jgi:hypothetical protein
MEPKTLEEQEAAIKNRNKYASDRVWVGGVKISSDGNPGSTA